MATVAQEGGIALSPAARALSTARRNYILAVLVTVGTFNWLDRQVLSVLLEPIRRDLHLSDSQLGLLNGIAFVLINVTLSIPAARLADAWSRRKVISLAVMIWSTMTIFCGFAHSMIHLFIARMGVGLGEAGGQPPSHAIVADIFPREKRSTAMAIFLLSTSFGSALGMLWGGLAADTFGWRMAFILAGLPGLLLGPLVFFTIPEIRQGFSEGVAAPRTQLPFWKTLDLLLSIGSFRNLLFGSLVRNFLSTGVSGWVPSYLARSHGMKMSEIGSHMAIVYVVSYTLGGLIGGRLVDAMGRRDARWSFWIASLTSLLSAAIGLLVFNVPSQYVFWMIGLQMSVSALWGGPMIAIPQSLSPVSFRASTSASVLFVVNLASLGIGPWCIGMISDLLRPTLGEQSLRATLLGVFVLAIPAAYFYFRAARTYRADLAAAEARNQAVAIQ